MAVSPLRSVIAAHAQGELNRIRKYQGNRGAAVTLITFVLLFIIFVLPGAVLLGYLGFTLGSTPTRDDPRALGLLSLGLTAFTVLLGSFGGLNGSTRQLPWDQLRAFPVSNLVLFAGELLAGWTEIITFLTLSATSALLTGFAVASPSAFPFVVLVGITSSVTLLSTQLVVGSLTQRLSKQFFVLLALLPFFAIILSAGAPAMVIRLSKRLKREVSGGLLDTVGELGAATPVGHLFQAWKRAGEGQVLGAALHLLPAVALLVVLIMVAFILVSRERDSESSDGGAAKKLWSFSNATWGMARLQWTVLTTSSPGRMSLLMPLLTVVLVRGPVSVVSKGPWVIPAAFAYASIAGANLIFNQFGLERHGIKALLLLPIEVRSILFGKQIGFAAWHLVQTVFLTVLLMLAGFRDPHDLALGFLVSICIHFMFSTAGQFLSIWQPRPVNRSGFRANNAPIMVALANLTVLTIAMGAVGIVTWASERLLGRWDWVGVALFLGSLIGVAAVALKFNADFLEANKERMVETLGAAP